MEQIHQIELKLQRDHGFSKDKLNDFKSDWNSGSETSCIVQEIEKRKRRLKGASRYDFGTLNAAMASQALKFVSKCQNIPLIRPRIRIDSTSKATTVTMFETQTQTRAQVIDVETKGKECNEDENKNERIESESSASSSRVSNLTGQIRLPLTQQVSETDSKLKQYLTTYGSVKIENIKKSLEYLINIHALLHDCASNDEASEKGLILANGLSELHTLAKKYKNVMKYISADQNNNDEESENINNNNNNNILTDEWPRLLGNYFSEFKTNLIQLQDSAIYPIAANRARILGKIDWFYRHYTGSQEGFNSLYNNYQK